MHAKLLNLKTFHLCKVKDIWKALIFFKDLNKNCDMMSLFLKTYHGLHIFKDFKDPWGPCNMLKELDWPSLQERRAEKTKRMALFHCVVNETVDVEASALMTRTKRFSRTINRVQLLLYKRVIVPTLAYNMQTASNFRESDFKRLEKMQRKCLRRICKMPESTPYWGILIELGVVPIEYEVHQKRLMLYHNIINSSDERITKQIVSQQCEYQRQHGFYNEVRKSAAALMIREDLLQNIRVIKTE